MSEEIKNQQAAEPEALTETEINEQMQVRINKMHQIEEKGWKPFGHKFEWTHHAQDIADQFEELTANETVCPAALWLSAVMAKPALSI